MGIKKSKAGGGVMEKTKKESHSKERIDFQDRYVEDGWVASDAIYAIAQWDKFIEFRKHVEGDK